MNEKPQSKTTRNKNHGVRRGVTVVAIFISCILFFIAIEDIKTMFSLKKEIASGEEQIVALESEHKDLTKRKEQLNDPEYVKRYARGKFLVSKPGEQIFKLPSKNEAMDD